MPIDYNRRIPQVERRIERCDGILEGNKEQLWKFERSLKVQDYSEARIYKLLSILKLLAERADFRFDEAVREDIEDLIAWVNGRDLAEATKNDYRIALKRFYRWLGDGEYPECVKWVNTTLKRSNNKLPEDLLTEEDVERLFEATKNARDKTLISVLWETGARIGEVMDLKIGSIANHEHGATILIQGGEGKKTGARRLLLISSVPHLRSWLNSHPRKGEKDAPLWVNIGTKKNNQHMRYRAVLAALNNVAERAGVDKPVNPHHFRHSRATYLANKLTESQMCEWFGWVQGSDRPADYVHMSGRDLDSDIARIHGIEDKSGPDKAKLSPIECPRCGEKNEPNAKFCQRCGLVLDREISLELKKKENFAESVISEMEKMKASGSLEEIIDKAVERKLRRIINEDLIEKIRNT